MRIATWNINGIKARLDGLITWLNETSPDLVCLQEIKSIDDGFPAPEIEALGYTVAVHGQKGFNGVALLAKGPLEDVRRGLPGDDLDLQARYIEAVVRGGHGMVRVAGLYLPNGNPIVTEKFDYKLRWMRRLIGHTRNLLINEEPLVVLGDFNVIPEAFDAKRPEAWVDDALAQPQSRALYAELLNLGLTDAVRACHPGAGIFTFWDYQAGAFQKDDGIRIDHILLSPQAADRLVTADVDKFTRAWDRPSDHVPVWVELNV